MVQSNKRKFGVDNFSKTDNFKEILRNKWFDKMKDKISHFGILNNICGDLYKITCILFQFDRYLKYTRFIYKKYKFKINNNFLINLCKHSRTVYPFVNP